MKRFAYKFSICAWILILNLGCTKKSASAPPAAPDKIQAASFVPTMPIIKGLSINPVLRIGITIPEGNSIQQYRKILCTLNNGAITAIQKIDVYVSLTGTNDITTSNLIATISPNSTTFEIPFTLNAPPSNPCIYLSVVLNNNAPINNKIELHATKLIDATGKELLIDQGNFIYSKYCGYALRKGGDDGVNTYRIPGLITTDKGTLIAVYDIRYNNSNDLPSYINVGMSRSTDNGNTWTPMKVILNMGTGTQQGVGDPSILFDPATKKIWVAALWAANGHSIAQSGPGLTPDVSGQLVMCNSNDDGLSWSSPINITSQVKDPAWKIFFQGPGRGIAMSNGTLVFPTQYWDASNVPYSTIIYSSNGGVNWQRASSAPKSNTTEAQVVETTPGTLMLNMRDNRGSYRSVSTTPDMGTNWTEHPTSYNTLPDPVCMASLIKANVNVKGLMKDILFFSNPNTSSAPRQNITIKASTDMGQSWPVSNQLLIDSRECYGYSCLTKIDDNNVGLLYEGTKDLYFVVIPVTDIIK
ncbi:MAG: exo-alpha-sialidase [Bacteroidetes bacterium]|nr:exo-alpha-sialidase [Bacteroidota bacterium]